MAAVPEDVPLGFLDPDFLRSMPPMDPLGQPMQAMETDWSAVPPAAAEWQHGGAAAPAPTVEVAEPPPQPQDFWPPT